MADTAIEWADKTWNPVAGCNLVSAGCANCYAMRMARRLEKMKAAVGSSSGQSASAGKYNGLTKVVNGRAVWTGKINLDEAALKLPLTWKKPARIFVNSMSDLFHADVPDYFVDKVFAVMALCPRHTFMVLTKRPERMEKYINEVENETVGDTCDRLLRAKPDFDQHMHGPFNWPLPNVWLGVSVESPEHLDRAWHLARTPASIRFISYEPALAQIDFTNAPCPGVGTWDVLTGRLHGTDSTFPTLDWLICGGESGPNARPMHPDWARSARDQCQAAGVKFFFKQWGEWAPGECALNTMTRTESVAQWYDNGWEFGTMTPRESEEQHSDDEPDLYRLGKRQAGRQLDGRTWDEVPEVVRS